MTHPLIFNVLQRNYLIIRYKKREASKPPQVIPLGFELDKFKVQNIKGLYNPPFLCVFNSYLI